MTANCSAPRLICSDPTLTEELRRLLAPHLPQLELLADPYACSQAPLCRWLDDAPLGPSGQLQAALGEAIATLERTRHAFRSRELGQLRRRLERLLNELSAPAE